MAGLRDGGITENWLDPIEKPLEDMMMFILTEPVPNPFPMISRGLDQGINMFQQIPQFSMPSMPPLPTEPEWLKAYRLSRGLVRQE